MLPVDLPAPLVAFGTLALVTTPMVYLDARNRGNDRARLWAIFTLVTFGHAALLYVLERDDPGQRQKDGGQYVLPGQDPPEERTAESGSSDTGS